MPARRRFVSDPLHFTGIDLGEGMASQHRRGYDNSPSTNEDTSEEASSGEHPDKGNGSQLQIAMRQKEESLVESALARIQKAQRKGKKEVKLNKEELAALERRRKRMQEEEAARRKREKDARIAVPISQLEESFHSSRGSRSSPDNDPPRGYPQMGYFRPPPSGPSSRPRSGTNQDRQPASRDRAAARDPSPFRYSYVQQGNPPRNSRHVSDTSVHSRSSRGPLPHEEDWAPSSSRAYATASAPSIPGTASRRPGSTLDPFQYMTAGPQAPYHGEPGASTSRRSYSGLSGDEDYRRAPRRSAPAASGGRSPAYQPASSGDETSEEATSPDARQRDDDDDDESSSSGDHGARIDAAAAARRRSRDAVVVEAEPDPGPPSPPPRERERERERTSAHQSSKKASPVKRKPVGSGSSSRRRKGRQ